MKLIFLNLFYANQHTFSSSTSATVVPLVSTIETAFALPGIEEVEKLVSSLLSYMIMVYALSNCYLTTSLADVFLPVAFIVMIKTPAGRMEMSNVIPLGKLLVISVFPLMSVMVTISIVLPVEIKVRISEAGFGKNVNGSNS